MSNTVFTMTATKAQSANTVHAMDAESAGTFEQLVGTILPPATKVQPLSVHCKTTDYIIDVAGIVVST